MSKKTKEGRSRAKSVRPRLRRERNRMPRLERRIGGGKQVKRKAKIIRWAAIGRYESDRVDRVDWAAALSELIESQERKEI